MGVRALHYGRQVWSHVMRKMKHGLKKAWKGVFKYIWILAPVVLGGAVITAVVTAKMYEEKIAKAEKLAAKKASDTARDKAIKRNRQAATNNLQVWSKSFQGPLTSVCHEVWYDEASYRYEIICHLGESGKLPIKKLVCSNLLCELSSL